MKYIGIIAAMDEEVKTVKELMTSVISKKVYELDFIEGKIHSKNVVIIKCGVGKVNAARVTQILVDNYDLEYIINVGTAGGLKNDIEIGDIIIAEKLVQHDFDITAVGHEKGYISDIGKFFYSDKKLLEKSKSVMEKMNEDCKVHVGKIATGDVFVQEISIKNRILEEFDADCTEMEGAAIAQICSLDNIPFIVIRAISDKPNGKNEVDFETYLNMACKRYSKFIDYYLS